MQKLGIGAVFILFLGSCFDAPEYPVEPHIEYKDIYFGDAEDLAAQDSLVLSLNFRDGDGDLGLDERDANTFKFANRYYYIIDGTEDEVITYNTRRTNPNYDTLPEFKTPFNCSNWEIISDESNAVIDTLYFELNPYHHNIVIDFLIKNDTDGSFTRFDPATYFIYPNCSINLFNGRFPVLSKDLGKESPLEGTIQYSMKSSVFNPLFSTKTLKLRIYIFDRNTSDPNNIPHKSNVIETPEFTLQEIRRG